MVVDRGTRGASEVRALQPQLENYGAFRSRTNDEVRNRYPHVSAVVTVHERAHAADWRERIMASHRAADRSFEAAHEAALSALDEINARARAGEEPSGSYQWVETFELDGEEATPLPSSWFSGRRDRRFGFHPSGAYGA